MAILKLTMRSLCFSTSACTVNSLTLFPDWRSRSTFFTHTNLRWMRGKCEGSPLRRLYVGQASKRRANVQRVR